MAQRGLGLLRRAVLARVQRLHDAAREFLQAQAAGFRHHLGALGVGELGVQPRQAHGHAGEHLGLHVAQAHGLQQRVQRHALLLVHRAAVGLVALAHAHAVDDDEVVLVHVLAGVHAAQVVVLDHAHAAALHLLEEAAALHAAHEDDDLHRLDVGAGGDHVHGDGDARVVAGAEGLDQVLGLARPWCGR